MDEQNMTEDSRPTPEGGPASSDDGGMGGRKSKTAKLIVVLAVIAVLAAIYAWTRPSPKGGIISREGAQSQESAGPPPPVFGTTITFTDDGYSPSTITIKKGQVIIFENRSAIETWPASAMHPTHTVYPGSGLEKCGTAEAAIIFDACRGLKAGESWIFQFNEAGTWRYHDHLSPQKFGEIVVE